MVGRTTEQGLHLVALTVGESEGPMQWLLPVGSTVLCTGSHRPERTRPGSLVSRPPRRKAQRSGDQASRWGRGNQKLQSEGVHLAILAGQSRPSIGSRGHTDDRGVRKPAGAPIEGRVTESKM